MSGFDAMMSGPGGRLPQSPEDYAAAMRKYAEEMMRHQKTAPSREVMLINRAVDVGVTASKEGLDFSTFMRRSDDQMVEAGIRAAAKHIIQELGGLEG